MTRAVCCGAPAALVAALLATLLAAVAHGLKFRPVAFGLDDPPPLLSALSPNYALTNAEKVHNRKLLGPASMAFMNGELYTVTSNGLVVSAAPCRPRAVANLKPKNCLSRRSCGLLTAIRPDRQNPGKLLVVDAYRGVFRVDPATAAVQQLMATDRIVGARRPVYLKDMVQAADGTILMTDASDVYDAVNDIYAVIEGRQGGRILSLNASSGVARAVLGDATNRPELAMAYPNGLELTPNEDAVLVSESARARVLRIGLRQNDFLRVSLFAGNLPGLPTNIRRSNRNTYWVSLMMVRHHGKPSPLDQYKLKPKARLWSMQNVKGADMREYWPKYGLVVELSDDGVILGSLHDPTGTAMDTVSETQEFEGLLYFVSKDRNFIGRIVLPQGDGRVITVDSALQVLRSRCQVSDDQLPAARRRLADYIGERSGAPREAPPPPTTTPPPPTTPRPPVSTVAARLASLLHGNNMVSHGRHTPPPRHSADHAHTHTHTHGGNQPSLSSLLQTSRPKQVQPSTNARQTPYTQQNQPSLSSLLQTSRPNQVQPNTNARQTPYTQQNKNSMSQAQMMALARARALQMQKMNPQLAAAAKLKMAEQAKKAQELAKKAQEQKKKAAEHANLVALGKRLVPKDKVASLSESQLVAIAKSQLLAHKQRLPTTSARPTTASFANMAPTVVPKSASQKQLQAAALAQARYKQQAQALAKIADKKRAEMEALNKAKQEQQAQIAKLAELTKQRQQEMAAIAARQRQVVKAFITTKVPAKFGLTQAQLAAYAKLQPSQQQALAGLSQQAQQAQLSALAKAMANNVQPSPSNVAAFTQNNQPAANPQTAQSNFPANSQQNPANPTYQTFPSAPPRPAVQPASPSLPPAPQNSGQLSAIDNMSPAELQEMARRYEAQLKALAESQKALSMPQSLYAKLNPSLSQPVQNSNPTMAQPSSASSGSQQFGSQPVVGDRNPGEAALFSELANPNNQQGVDVLNI